MLILSYLCIYFFFFFFIDKKKKRCLEAELIFLHSKIWQTNSYRKILIYQIGAPVYFSQESGFNQMPYDLHPFLIFFTSCQLRQKRFKYHKTNLTEVLVYRLQHHVEHRFYSETT